ncbi:hypothetical protein HMPREF3191_00078 [Veillonellaceae bacterium DNF00626]|nr:hypothetical protein HMPREF3191_00078 [Veillonellaceae bacterium DNF00626]
MVTPLLNEIIILFYKQTCFIFLVYVVYFIKIDKSNLLSLCKNKKYMLKCFIKVKFIFSKKKNRGRKIFCCQILVSGDKMNIKILFYLR